MTSRETISEGHICKPANSETRSWPLVTTQWEMTTRWSSRKASWDAGGAFFGVCRITPARKRQLETAFSPLDYDDDHDVWYVRHGLPVFTWRPVILACVHATSKGFLAISYNSNNLNFVGAKASPILPQLEVHQGTRMQDMVPARNIVNTSNYLSNILLVQDSANKAAHEVSNTFKVRLLSDKA